MKKLTGTNQKGALMIKTQDAVDPDTNPFACPSWIKQGYGLTEKRCRQLSLLFGNTVQEIRSGNRNMCRYPAFLGIRRGVAEISEGKLVPTEQWKSPVSE